MDRKVRQQMYKSHAEYCRSLANPRRLEILDLLRSGKLSLETLRERMKIQRPALSQHLAILKHKFFGSPTVQIDDLDVDPKAKAVTKYGMASCRLFLRYTDPH